MLDIGSYLGELAGRKAAEKFGSGFDNLDRALDYLFSWEKDFSLQIQDNKIISSGLCPIKRFYPSFCDEGCLEFNEFARHFDAEVSRVSTDPCFWGLLKKISNHLELSKK